MPDALTGRAHGASIGAFDCQEDFVRRAANARRGFTLIELLIVIAIIGVLAAMLLGAIFKARTRSLEAIAKSEIQSIKSALAMYESDHGRFPRWGAPPNGARPTTMGDAFNDAAALYRGLRNKPTLVLGGGQNSPYLEWKSEKIGVVDAAALRTFQATIFAANPPIPLTSADADRVNVATFQNGYRGPASGQVLVLLDPWGNPYNYREWGSVRQSVKDTFMANSTAAPGFGLVLAPANNRQGAPVLPAAQLRDAPHTPTSFDIWSNGSNGVNEFGTIDSDDLTSWR